jgi:hypothetical protein
VPGFSRSVTRIRLVTTEASPRRRFHLIVYGRSGRNCWCTRWCAQIRRYGRPRRGGWGRTLGTEFHGRQYSGNRRAGRRGR